MKILQVINRLNRGGGAEKFMLELALAQNAMDGVEVEILNMTTPKNEDFVDEARRHGIKVSTMSKRLRQVKNIARTGRYIKENGFDVVHVHLFPALYILAVAKLLFRFPAKMVYTEHSTSNRRRRLKFWRMVDWVIYRRYTHVVAISDQVKINLEKHIGLCNVCLINNGVDVQAISTTRPLDLRKELNIPSDSKIVTMVARFAAGKDYKTLFESLAFLPDNVHVVCVGNGPLMEDAQAFVDNLSQKGRIHLLGLRSDVIEILKASNFVVLSTKHEGFSISMLEAMACRKPFVATAVPGVKDLVDGVAELFEYQNPKQLAERIACLLNDPEHCNEVASRCFDFASRYDIRTVALSYINVYRQ